MPDAKVSNIKMADAQNDNKKMTDAVLSVTENDKEICIRQMEGTFEYILDKRTGMFAKMRYHKQEMLTRPMEVNIWRAPTDNDMHIKSEWYRARYNRTYTRTHEVSVEFSNSVLQKSVIATELRAKDDVKIKCKMALVADAVQNILALNVVWTVSGDGALTYEVLAEKNPEFPVLPRFGIRMFLPEDYEQIEFFGMGPMESYADKHRAANHGIYAMHIKEMHEDYLCPQENGSHYDCSYVIVEGSRQELQVVSERAFSFNASVYTQEELEAKHHNFELKTCGSSVLCIDDAQNGIGSGSCGPLPKKKYLLDNLALNFKVKLIPYVFLNGEKK